MPNRFRFANRHTRQHGTVADRLAGGATVLQLAALGIGDCGDILIVIVENHLEHAGRAARHTLAAAVAAVGVNGDKKLAGTVFVAIIGDHWTVASFWASVRPNRAA